MKIIVLNRKETEKISEDGKSLFVISITDPEKPLAKINVSEERILRLQFYDTEWKVPLLDGEFIYPMSKEDAIKIVNFINKNIQNIETLIVHCEAGISRSAGIGAAISNFFNKDDKEYFESYRYVPNRWCYRNVLNAFMEAKIDD